MRGRTDAAAKSAIGTRENICHREIFASTCPGRLFRQHDGFRTARLYRAASRKSDTRRTVVAVRRFRRADLILVAASNFFGAVFSRLGTPTMLIELLLGLELNRYVVLFLIMGLIFLLGWPLEWVPIVLIIVPIVFAVDRPIGFQFDLVRHIGSSQFANRMVIATGCFVSLLPKGRRSGVGPQGYLSRHDAVHGAAGNWSHSDHRVPTDRPLVADGHVRKVRRPRNEKEMSYAP